MTWNWKYHFLNIHGLEKLRFEFCIWNTTSDLRNSVICFIHSNIVLSVITSFLNLIIEVISVFSVRAICRLCGEIFNPSPIFESCRLIIYWDAVVKVRLRALIRILTSCQQPMRGLWWSQLSTDITRGALDFTASVMGMTWHNWMFLLALSVMSWFIPHAHCLNREWEPSLNEHCKF